MPRTAPRRPGATTVETAIVISITLLFLLGIFEYGRLLMVMHIANNAAFDGARYAIVHTGDGTTKQNIIDYTTGRMAGRQADLTGFTVDVFTVDATALSGSPPAVQARSGSTWNDARFGEDIAVKITGSYKPVLPSFLRMGSTVPINVVVAMRSEAN